MPGAAPAASRGRGRKSAASKAADGKASEQDDAIKQQLLDHPHRPLTLAQAATVYQLHLPPCAPLIPPPSQQSAAPKACKPAGHPNCLHTLGYQRKGMWAAHPPHLALLGSNPADSHRSDGWYAGLKNQGATCYLNILMQSLYLNTHFRDSLMRFDSSNADVRRQWEQAIASPSAPIPSVDPSTSAAASSSDSSLSVAAQHLPYHLLSLFTRLALSHRSFIDPVSLVRAMGLENDVQQDAHEFRSMLLQALENALLSSTYTPHHTLLQTLFEGNNKSILRCQQCGHESTTASPFIDLTLPIKGRGSVYASMRSLCDVEQLEENAVYCSTCRAKTSMDKRLEYEQLPPYLNVQLMRFELVFAGNGVRKKKIGDKIYTPEKIRMEGCLLKPASENDKGVDSVKCEEAQQQTEAVKEEEAVKAEGEIEELKTNGTARKRGGGRRRVAVKEELLEEEDVASERTVKAEAAVKVEESISDEEGVDGASEQHTTASNKRGMSSARGRGKGGRQKRSAAANGAGENGESAGASRGRGGRRGRGGGKVVEPVVSAEEAHEQQNGHAAVEVIEIDNDDTPRRRVTRASGGKWEKDELFGGGTTEAWDSTYKASRAKRKLDTAANEREMGAERRSAEQATNGHRRPSTPSVQPNQPASPQSPVFHFEALDVDSDGESAARGSSEQARSKGASVAASPLHPSGLSAEAQSEVVALELDDAEDESLETKMQNRAAAKLTEAARNGASARKPTRRKLARIGQPKKKPHRRQTAAQGRVESADKERTTQGMEDVDDSVLAADPPVQPAGKRRKAETATAAAAMNGTGRSKPASKADSKKVSKSKRAQPSDCPSPAPSPPHVPAPSVYSPAPHPSDYHLAAVLLHKGQYANHGHYTATLRDDRGVWWSFDDRVVTRVGEKFYNKGGEVVDAKAKGKQTEESSKEADGKGAKEGEVKEQNGSNSVEIERGKAAEPEVVEMEVEQVIKAEPAPPPAKKRGRAAKVKAEEQGEGAVTESAANDLPAKPKRGRPRKEVADTAAAEADAVEDKSATAAKRKGKLKKAAAPKVNADASGVDAKTKAEAERMYGPGGYSKDAYMLLYCNKNHPALAKLKSEQDRADAELHSHGEQPATFHFAQSHPLIAELFTFIRKYHSDEIARENAAYLAECAAYKEKRAVIDAEIERRKAEVVSVASMLQAEAIEVDKAADEQQDAPLEERAETLEQGKRTRFVSTQWLARFLTGWTEPEKAAKTEAKDKKQTDKSEKAEGKEKAGDDRSEQEAGHKEDRTSPVIDVSSDDDSSADNTAEAERKEGKGHDTAADESAEGKEEQTGSDSRKEEKEDDPGAIVVDHDVHISADGMEEAMRQAIGQLDAGPLTDSVNSLRCPHHSDKLNPHKLTAVKRISVEAWSVLLKLDQERSRKLLLEAAPRLEAASVAGDVDMIPSSQSDEADVAIPAVPELALSDVCLECARTLFLGDLTRKRKVERVRLLLEEYFKYRSDHRSDSAPPAGSLWISAAFIQRWKKHCQQLVASARAAKDAAQQAALADKQQELDAVQLGDALEDVKCEHGELSTDKTERLWVSRKLWQSITEMASVAEAEMIDVGAEECVVCKGEEEQGNEEAAQHKAAMKDERAALRAWANKSHRFPDPSTSPVALFSKSPSGVIYLLPESFQSDVYAFLQQRDPTNPPRPRFSAAPMLCEHQLLKYVPRPEESVAGQGNVAGTRLGVLVFCDEKVWAELKRYGYVEEGEAGVQLQCTRILTGTGVVNEQWSSYQLTSTPAVCDECVKKRQAEEETGRTVFTREDGGGIRVTTVATEEEAKSTASASSPPPTSASPAASPPAAQPISIRPRRAAAARGGKQAVAIVELNCASSDTVYDLKMELLAQSVSGAWEPARQRWYWRGAAMDDAHTLAQHGVTRGGEVKVWLGGDSEWDGTEVGRMELYSEGKRGGKGAAAERGFQGTALAMHARQHVQNSASQQSAASGQVQGAAVGGLAGEPHSRTDGVAKSSASADEASRPERLDLANVKPSVEAA